MSLNARDDVEATSTGITSIMCGFSIMSTESKHAFAGGRIIASSDHTRKSSVLHKRRSATDKDEGKTEGRIWMKYARDAFDFTLITFLVNNQSIL